MRRVLWELEFARRRLRPLWAEMDRFESASPSLARKALAERLLAQIHYFGARGDALPEWREAMRISDPDDLWAIWQTLPIVTKYDLQNRFHPADMARRFNLHGWATSTGGSTGEPTPFFHDESMIRVMAASRLYAWQRMGWKPGTPIIVVWGSERDIGGRRSFSGRVKTYLQNIYLVDGYQLSESTIQQVVEHTRRHKRVCMYGFTSMLEFVARGLNARDDASLRGRVDSAWNGGEMLFEPQSRQFELAFGVPILNLYGGRELSAMAVQSRVGSPLRVLRPSLMVEIVDDAGRPVGPGETGRLVWTSTVCRGTPFLRYDVGDLGSYRADDCDESGIRALDELQGRQAGLIELADGRTINCLYWNHLFKEFPEVEQFQVTWRARRELELRLKGSQFSPQREEQLRRTATIVLGTTPISIQWMDRIPRTAQGKLLQVVRE